MDSAILPATQFKDRKVGLVIFGVMTVLAGCCWALFVPLMIFGAQMAARSPHPPPSAPNIMPIAALHGALAVIFVWLGVGSIMTRRWARALLVICSWSWLITGTIAVAAMALMAPQLAASIQAAQPAGHSQLSGGARTAMILVPVVMVTVLMVIIPLLWALFYSGRNVKATCEARDPVVRWTDRCPLPVLAMSVWLAFGAFSMLVMPAFHSAAPFFGLLLSRAVGTVFYLCLAAIWAYSAWRIYHLDTRGWWIIAIAMVLFALSNVITYSRHDIGEVYALMGYPPAQIAEIRRIGFMGGHTMAWSSLLFTVPFLGYLCYMRKFFKHGRGDAAAVNP
jgi:hypothetical protein